MTRPQRANATTESGAVALRPAQSSFEEGLIFARLLDTAADGIFRLILGRGSDQVLAKAFLQPGHDLSYQRVTFAIIDNQIVGMLSAYSGKQHAASSIKPLFHAAGLKTIRLLGFGIVFASMVRALDTIESSDFYIQAIAVDSAARGQRVGSLLMNHAEAVAAQHGARHLCLDVAEKNRHARDVYEHRGMTEVSRWPKRLTLGNLKLIRMSKPLTA